MIHFAPSSIAWLVVWLLVLAGLVWQAQSFRTRQRDIIGSMNKWFAVSVVFLVIASGSMAVKGLNYGLDFTAAVQVDNIIGVQFHPEKSHRYGKQLLGQFAGGAR